jgi:hypothetical protein
MNAQELLQEISDYCRQTGLAESTFGRRAVNDGKLASRLRHGGRITTETLDRIRSFMTTNRNSVARPAVISRGHETPQALAAPRPMMAAPPAPLAASTSRPSSPPPGSGSDPQRNFRFFDNRQKYLLFVNTCSEKWVVANRVSLELHNIHPRPPALRLFDAGVGDGTVLLRVMRAMHDRFPHTPCYAVGKEISLEDVRLAMQKMSDRFTEHPARDPRNTRDTRHERARAVAGNFRLLPADRPRRIHLRPPRGQRRQACQPAPPRRPHHHRDARPHPHLHGDQPQRGGASGGHLARTRNAAGHRGAAADDGGASARSFGRADLRNEPAVESASR